MDCTNPVHRRSWGPSRPVPFHQSLASCSPPLRLPFALRRFRAIAISVHPGPGVGPTPGQIVWRGEARRVLQERVVCGRDTPPFPQGSGQAAPVCPPVPRIRKEPSPFRAGGTRWRSTPPRDRSWGLAPGDRFHQKPASHSPPSLLHLPSSTFRVQSSPDPPQPLGHRAIGVLGDRLTLHHGPRNLLVEESGPRLRWRR